MDGTGATETRTTTPFLHDEAGNADSTNNRQQHAPTVKNLKRARRFRNIGIAVFSGFFMFIVGIFIVFVVNSHSLFIVNGDSMNPTLNDRDIVVIKQSEEVNRGELIFFKTFFGKNNEANGKTAVKRIAGISGDTVKVGEDFIQIGDNKYETKECSAPIGYQRKIGRNQVFVVGDNRDASLDSITMLCNNQFDKIFVNDRQIIDYGKIERVFSL